MNRPARAIQRGIPILLGIGLLVLGGLSFSRQISRTEPYTGIDWVQSGVGPLALSVDPSGPGWAAGVRPGDRLLAVDGEPVSNALDANQAPWTTALGAPLRLRLSRSGSELEASVRVRWTAGGPGMPIFGYLAVVGAAFLVSGLLVAIGWPGVRGGVVYAWLTISLFSLLVFSPTGRGDGIDWTLSWLDWIGGAMAPALLVHLTAVVARRPRPRRRMLALAYAPAVALVAATVWLVALGGQYRFADPVVVHEVRSRLALIFLGVAVGASFLILLRAYARTSSGLHRGQLRSMMWALGAGLGPFLLIYALPWALGEEVPRWAELSLFPILIVPAAMTVALVRYRLQDLDLWLRRGLTEVTAIAATLAVYGISQFVLRSEGAGIFDLSNSQARYAGILVVLLAFTKIRGAVGVWIDRAFYQKRYSYRATLLDWARQLSADTDLQSIVDHIRHRVRETLVVPEVRVYVRRGRRSFEAQVEREAASRIELEPVQLTHLEGHPYLDVGRSGLAGARWAQHLFAMRVKGRLRALLAVAEREPSQEPLSSEDRSLLSTLSAIAATSIEAARLLQEVRDGAIEVSRLQAQQERILESSGVGLLLVDGGGRVLAWNRALEILYALPRDEALGKTVGEVFPLHLIRTMERELRNTPQGEEARLYRYSLINRAGERIAVNISVSPAGDERVGARVVSFDDITERVKLEEQVLQQERLASLGLLAAGVAHEVNTPLTGISSYAQLLIEELPQADPRRDVLQKIEAQTQRASEIANSLLNLAQPQRSGYGALDLNEAVDDALRLFEPQIRRRAIRLETHLAEGLSPVHAHRGKLQQVLLNLLLNARDAIGDQGTMTVRTRAVEGGAIVEVVDDGSGISAEDLPRIFDPFFTTKGRGKGTGLGLSITYGIVQEHGGEIVADSLPGETTRFSVRLRAADSAQAYG